MSKWKNKDTSMWIIHIKLKCFCWEEKLFLGQEKKIYKITGQILYGKIKLVSYVLQIMLCLCKQEKICMSFLLHVSVRKSTPEIGVKFLVFFTFFINFFMITFIKSIIYCQTVSFRPFSYVCCESCMSGFSAFILNLSKSDNILFR